MAPYKLATYQSSDGPRAGLVIEDKVFDAAKLTGKAAYATVLGILEDWRAAQGALKKAAANAGKAGAKEGARVASRLCRSAVPSCWRRYAGRPPSTAPAPTMPTTPRKWRDA